MRIGILARHYHEKGGIAVYTQELLRHLFRQDQSNSYTVFLGDGSAEGEFRGLPNVSTVILPCGNKLYWDQVQVAGRANAMGLDLLFSPKMTVPFRFRGKKVLTIHGGEQFLFPQEFPLSDRLYVKFLLPRYARAADCILTVSETSKQDLARILGVSESKFRVTPHGAKTVFVEPLPADEIQAIRTRYGLSGPFILYVGLVWGAKNFTVFPEVLRRLNQDRAPGDRIVLAHAGKPYRWDTADRGAGAIPSEHILSLGFVPDHELAALYQSAIALVFPSLYEGFGIPLLEAMAAGCPVITTGWGAMKEVTAGAAVYIDPRNPQDIADAIGRLAGDEGLRSDLRTRGLDRARQFSWEITAKLTLDAFQQLDR